MIKTKLDLMYYLNQDKIALFNRKKNNRPRFFGDEIWKFEISLRHLEYASNRGLSIIRKNYWRMIYHHYKMKLGFDIPINTFGPGLCIRHFGCIIVHENARIGKNCIIQQGVNIGMNNGDKNSVPHIGDDVYIGPGAKIFGGIVIADGVAIGANSVVNKSCHEKKVTIAGIPAKVVGIRNSDLK